jgi:ribosomal protein L40E
MEIIITVGASLGIIYLILRLLPTPLESFIPEKAISFFTAVAFLFVSLYILGFLTLLTGIRLFADLRIIVFLIFLGFILINPLRSLWKKKFAKPSSREYWICKKCGTENPEVMLECRKCSAPKP